jgi:hypothetical protein
MVLRGAYVVARGQSGRPTVQHKLIAGSASDTGCGRDLSGLSRSYTHEVLEAILCKQGGCHQAPVGR